MTVRAGVHRVCITPPPGVELTGWGYYLERTWLDIHDDLNATSLVVDNGEAALAIVSLDLMVISDDFTRRVREQVAAATDLSESVILVCCEHSHNAPASGGLLGVGEVDPNYETWAADRAAESAIAAWQSREEASLSAGSTEVTGLTFNRTRENGPVDPTLTTLRVDRADGSVMAVVVGFQAHPTIATVLRPRSVSRDAPGGICDRIEAAFPDSLALYLQGACGDVNFLREFSTPERCEEPVDVVGSAAVELLGRTTPVDASQLGASSIRANIPTRRWTREEIDHDREEALQRLRDKDVTGWKDTIGRVMTNRPDDMVARHGGDEWKAVSAMCRFNQAWTDLMLVDLETRPETLDTEIQALRIGDFAIVSNSSEFFTTLALRVREGSPFKHLMLACYANGRIGYMPDAHDVERKTYASYQSPKYCNQFPFTAESGDVIVDAMIEQLVAVADD